MAGEEGESGIFRRKKGECAMGFYNYKKKLCDNIM